MYFFVCLHNQLPDYFPPNSSIIELILPEVAPNAQQIHCLSGLRSNCQFRGGGPSSGYSVSSQGPKHQKFGEFVENNFGPTEINVEENSKQQTRPNANAHQVKMSEFKKIYQNLTHRTSSVYFDENRLEILSHCVFVFVEGQLSDASFEVAPVAAMPNNEH